LIVFGAGIGAERRQLILKHWLETPTASFGGYHEERSVEKRGIAFMASRSRG
jgi:hypothetical protein